MNVWDAAQDRLRTIFEEFDNVYVSFSGGKDSGVLLNMAVDYARSIGRKIGCFHIDYEAQYQMTTDYVDEEMQRNRDVVEYYRICLPIAAQCCTSMSHAYWIPWDSTKQDIWVRPLPEESVNESNHEFDWFKKGMWDYELQSRFTDWYHKAKGAKRTACLVGIRTQESHRRWATIHGVKKREEAKYDGLNWTTMVSKDCFNCYPIYDWDVEDIWTANARFGWAYNKLYDLFYMAGVKPNDMRVASPFNDCAAESLKLYRVIDPNTWGKMIGRVNGVNFTGIYGGTTAMGWKSIKLPEGHTWKSYLDFLLSTLSPSVAENYKKKLAFSQKFWREKGGGLPPRAVKELERLGVKHSIGDQPRKNVVFADHLPVTMEYLDDIDIPDFRLIPTYKRMCICIMKNDHTCKYMGFGLTKTEWALRHMAEERYAKIKEQKSE